MAGLPLLLIVFLCSSALGTPQQSPLPCPVPADIAPCTCQLNQGQNIDIDCSQIKSEAELAKAFSAQFPFTNFHQLTIERNSNLKQLKKGHLGNASFEKVKIRRGALEGVEPGALEGSSKTATELDFRGNRLSTFPFEELPLFASLKTLHLAYNALPKFPSLSSDSLENLFLDGNGLTELPLTAFSCVENIYRIYLSANNLEEIIPGTFSELPNLHYLHLAQNKLSNIEKGAITLGGKQRGTVYLRFNNISTIDVGGITGLGEGYLELTSNAIEELPEDVFQPILDEGARVRLAGNQLGCGCDILWLLSNGDFMDQIASTPPASCYTGELLKDLDVAIYNKLC